MVALTSDSWIYQETSLLGDSLLGLYSDFCCEISVNFMEFNICRSFNVIQTLNVEANATALVTYIKLRCIIPILY